MPTHSLSSTIIPCTNPSSTIYSPSNHFEPPSSFTLQLPPLNLLPSHSNFHTSSATSVPTASAHNCSSIPHHNFVPPQPRVISLHAHSVAAAMHSFLYNISHTPIERSPHALPCSSNGETAATKKETANKANINPKIRKCSHWCGNLISCYTFSLEVTCDFFYAL